MRARFARTPLSSYLAARRLWWAAPFLAPGLAGANPTGADVVSGDIAISSPDANTLRIDQNSATASINWQSFSIGADEFVVFNQPSASALALNRVIGGNPSEIFGQLLANGRVFLINPSGILFGATARVDVGALVASTAQISDTDFAAGRYVLTGAGTASIANAGSLVAGPNGFVVLAAGEVSNTGVIQAVLGEVVLASGSAFTLDLTGDGLINFTVDEASVAASAGVGNLGQIVADGGRVLMTAKAAGDLARAVVNNEGLVQAHSISETESGEIVLTASGGDIVNAGTLDASGVNGADGGRVVLKGDRGTRLTPDSEIRATGDGPAALGGRVHVSGKSVSVRGLLSIGRGGTFLLDPQDLIIANGTNACTTACLGPFASTGSATVYEEFIENTLRAGTNVILTATRSIVLRDLTTDGELRGTDTIGGRGDDGSLTLGIGSSSGGEFYGGPGEVAGPYGSGIHFENRNNSIITGRGLRLIAGSVYGSIDVGDLSAGGLVELKSAGPIAAGDITVTGSEVGVLTQATFKASGSGVAVGNITVSAFGSNGSASVDIDGFGGDIVTGNIDVDGVGAESGTGTAKVNLNVGPANLQTGFVDVRAIGGAGASAEARFNTDTGNLTVNGPVDVVAGANPSGVATAKTNFNTGVGALHTQDVTARADAFRGTALAENRFNTGTGPLTTGNVNASAYGGLTGNATAQNNFNTGSGTLTVQNVSAWASASSFGRAFAETRLNTGNGDLYGGDFNLFADQYGGGSFGAAVKLVGNTGTGNISIGNVFAQAHTVNGGAFGGAAADVDLNTGTGDITTGNIVVQAMADFDDADALVDLNGDGIAVGDVTVQTVAGGFDYGGDLDLGAGSYGLTAGRLDATGNVDVRTGTGFAGRIDVHAGRDLTISGPVLGSTSSAVLSAGDDVTVNGSISVSPQSGRGALGMFAGGNVVIRGDVDVSGYGDGIYGQDPRQQQFELPGPGPGGAAAARLIINARGDITIGTAEIPDAEVRVTAHEGRGFMDLFAGDDQFSGSAQGTLAVYGGVHVYGGGGLNSTLEEFPVVAGAILEARQYGGAGGLVYVAGAVNVMGTPVTINTSRNFSSPTFFGPTYGGFSASNLAFSGVGGNAALDVTADHLADVGSVEVRAQGDVSVRLRGQNGVTVRGAAQAIATGGTGTFHSDTSFANYGSMGTFFGAGSHSQNYAGTFGDASLLVVGGDILEFTPESFSITPNPAAAVDVGSITVQGPGAHLGVNGGTIRIGDGANAITVAADGTLNLTSSGTFNGSPFGPNVSYGAADAFIGAVGSDGFGESVFIDGAVSVTGLDKAPARLDVDGNEDIVILGDVDVSGYGQGVPAGGFGPRASGPDPTAARAVLHSRFGSVTLGAPGQGIAVNVAGHNGRASLIVAAASFGSYGDIRVFGTLDVSGGGGEMLNPSFNAFGSPIAPNVATLDLSARGSGGSGGNVTVTGAITVTGNPVVASFRNTGSSTIPTGSYAGGVSYGTTFATARGGDALLRVTGDNDIQLNRLTLNASGDARLHVVAGGNVTVSGPTLVDAGESFTSSGSSHRIEYGGGTVSFGQGGWTRSQGEARALFVTGSASDFGFFVSPDPSGVVSLGAVSATGVAANVRIEGGRIFLGSETGAPAATVAGDGHALVFSGSTNGVGSTNGLYGGFATLRINGIAGSAGTGSESAAVVSRGNVRVSALSRSANATLDADGYGGMRIDGDITVEDYGASDARADLHSQIGSVAVAGAIRVQNFENRADLVMGAYGDIAVGGLTRVLGDSRARADFVSQTGDIATGGITVSGSYAGLSMSAPGDITTGALDLTATSSTAAALLGAGGNILTGAVDIDADSWRGAFTATAGGHITTGAIDIAAANVAAVALSAGSDILTGPIDLAAATGSANASISASGNLTVTGAIDVLSSESGAFAFLSAGNDLTVTGAVRADGASGGIAFSAGNDLTVGGLTELDVQGGSFAHVNYRAGANLGAGGVTIMAGSARARLDLHAGTAGAGDLDVIGGIDLAGQGNSFSGQAAWARLDANSSAGVGGDVTVTGRTRLLGNPYVNSSAGTSTGTAGSFGSISTFNSFDHFESRNGGATLWVTADRTAGLGSIDLDATGSASLIVVGDAGVLLAGPVTVDAATAVSRNFSFNSSSNAGSVTFTTTRSESRGGQADVRIFGGSCSFGPFCVDPDTTVDLGRLTANGPTANVFVGGGQVRLDNLGSGNAITVNGTGTFNSSFASSNGSIFTDFAVYGGVASLGLTALSGSNGTGSASAAIFSQGGILVSALAESASASLSVDAYGSVVINGGITVEDSGAEAGAQVLSQIGSIAVAGNVRVDNRRLGGHASFNALGDIVTGGFEVSGASGANLFVNATGDLTVNGAVDVDGGAGYGSLHLMADGLLSVNGDVVAVGGANAFAFVHANDAIAVDGGVVNLRNGVLTAVNSVSVVTTGGITLAGMQLGGSELGVTPTLALDGGAGDVILDNVTGFAGFATFAAGGAITSTSLHLTAEALQILAGTQIHFAGGTLTIGTGVVPLPPDTLARTLLDAQAAGLVGSLEPNFYAAAPSVTLGSLILTGQGVYIKADAIDYLGTLSAPTEFLVHYDTFTPNAAIRIVNSLPQNPIPGAVYYVAGVIFGYPGTTYLIGNSRAGNAVFLGEDGSFDITGTDSQTHLVLMTSGAVTGRGNVQTNGQVVVINPAATLTALPITDNFESDTMKGGSQEEDKKDNLEHEQQPGSDQGGPGGDGGIQQQTNAQATLECQ